MNVLSTYKGLMAEYDWEINRSTTIRVCPFSIVGVGEENPPSQISVFPIRSWQINSLSYERERDISIQDIVIHVQGYSDIIDTYLSFHAFSYYARFHVYLENVEKQLGLSRDFFKGKPSAIMLAAVISPHFDEDGLRVMMRLNDGHPFQLIDLDETDLVDHNIQRMSLELEEI